MTANLKNEKMCGIRNFFYTYFHLKHGLEVKFVSQLSQQQGCKSLFTPIFSYIAKQLTYRILRYGWNI